MGTLDLINIADQWLSAFNRRDLEALLSLYHERAEHYSPKLKIRIPESKGLISGKPELRRWWQDSFDRLPTLQYEKIQLTPYENRVFMEYLRHVAGEEDIRVGEILEVRDGLIVSSRVYHG